MNITIKNEKGEKITIDPAEMDWKHCYDDTVFAYKVFLKTDSFGTRVCLDGREKWIAEDGAVCRVGPVGEYTATDGKHKIAVVDVPKKGSGVFLNGSAAEVIGGESNLSKEELYKQERVAIEKWLRKLNNLAWYIGKGTPIVFFGYADNVKWNLTDETGEIPPRYEPIDEETGIAKLIAGLTGGDRRAVYYP